MSEAKVGKAELVQFGVLMFGVGMIAGTLLNYLDTAFPDDPKWWAYPLIFVSLVWIILGCVGGYRIIARTLAEKEKVD